MVIGLGTELVKLETMRLWLQERGATWLLATWTEAERATCQQRVDPAPGLAARLAAKVATLAALGHPEGVKLNEVEIVRQTSGKPDLALHGAARDAGARLGVTAAHVTLTHAETHALAIVVLEGSPPDGAGAAA